MVSGVGIQIDRKAQYEPRQSDCEFPEYNVLMEHKLLEKKKLLV